MSRDHAILALFAATLAATPLAAGGDERPAAVAGSAKGHVPDPISYRIGPADRLAIFVFNSDALTREVLVRPDGYIDLPLAGTVRAAGLTAGQLAEALAERLRASMIEPTVHVSVVEAAGFSHRIRIIGAAGKPTSIPFKDGMRLLDAVEQAGGLAPEANGNSALLIRGTVTRRIRLDDLIGDGDDEANPRLQAEDTIVIPEGFFAGDWRKAYALTVGATVTDNYDLAPEGEAALIMSVTPQMKIAGEGARARAAAEVALTGEFVTLAENKQRLVPNVLALSSTELARDTFFLDASANVAEVALDPASATSGSSRNDINRTLVQAYEASPYLVTRVPGVGTIETRYSLAGLVTDDDGEQTREPFAATEATLVDSVINRAEVRFATPKRGGSRLVTDALAYGALTTRFGAADATEYGAVALPSYRLARGWTPIGRAGYSRLDVGGETLDGPDVGAGVEYQPSPSLSLRALAGWRLENPQADVLLRWDIGPATQLTMGYMDMVGLGQTQLIYSLSDLEYDAEDQRFINQRTKLAYLTTPAGLTLDDALSRTSRFDVTATHTLGSVGLGLTGFASRQQPVDGSTDSRGGTSDSVDRLTWGAVATGVRKLNQSISLALQAGFLEIEPKGDSGADIADGGGSFSEASTGFDVSYAFSDVVSVVAGYRYTRRFADLREDEYTENLFFTGVTRRF
jgi:polysaccharide export outer membrane protein